MAAVPARAFERIGSGTDSAEPSPAVSAPEGAPQPSALSRMTAWIRENPRVTVAVVGGVLLVCVWITWAVYVTSENGASAGLGVMIAWPAMVAALALISLPFIGGYMLFRRLSIDEGNPASAADDPESTHAEQAGDQASSEEEEEEEEEEVHFG